MRAGTRSELALDGSVAAIRSQRHSSRCPSRESNQWHDNVWRGREPRASGRGWPCRLSLQCNGCKRTASHRGTIGHSPKRRNFASLANIAHLHFRVQRQVGEDEAALGATSHSHAAAADAISSRVLRHCEPCKREAGHARDATAHVPSRVFRPRSDCLLISCGPKQLVPDHSSQFAPYARDGSLSSKFGYPRWRICVILRGG